MKDFEGVVDEQKAEEDAEKILTGNFDLHDFVEQIKLVKKMGSVNDLLEKFPSRRAAGGHHLRRQGAGPRRGDDRVG